ncbi:hypothetical protein AURDEDRAFT_152968 [Auricularia subglabra TFB-10046 SS5]|nr:hypothetical protein AURDEDRAFT_152968 [Auricularia subglabra TFB-10046 SS5]
MLSVSFSVGSHEAYTTKSLSLHGTAHEVSIVFEEGAHVYTSPDLKLGTLHAMKDKPLIGRLVFRYTYDKAADGADSITVCGPDYESADGMTLVTFPEGLEMAACFERASGAGFAADEIHHNLFWDTRSPLFPRAWDIFKGIARDATHALINSLAAHDDIYVNIRTPFPNLSPEEYEQLCTVFQDGELQGTLAAVSGEVLRSGKGGFEIRDVRSQFDRILQFPLNHTFANVLGSTGDHIPSGGSWIKFWGASMVPPRTATICASFQFPSSVTGCVRGASLVGGHIIEQAAAAQVQTGSNHGRKWPLHYRLSRRKFTAPSRGGILRGLFHEGYWCSVSGPPKEKYDLPVYSPQRHGNTITAWIESEANKTFEISICNTKKTEKTPTCCFTFVDGKLIEGPVIGNGKLFNVADICGVENRKTHTMRRFLFRSIKVTDDKKAATKKGKDDVAQLGTIRVELYRVTINGWKDDDDDDGDASEDKESGLHEDAVILESEKIMNGHYTGLGKEEPSTATAKNLDFEFQDKEAFITFEFRYAPSQVLLSLDGVVPECPRVMNWGSDGNLPDQDDDDADPIYGGQIPRRQIPELRARSTSTPSDRQPRASVGRVQSVKSEDKPEMLPEQPQSQPVRRSPRKKVKVEQTASPPADDILQNVKRERSADAMPQNVLDRTDPVIGRTVKVDPDDYVAALEAQNRALQALLPERERVRIVKNEPLDPTRHYKRGEVIDLSDA